MILFLWIENQVCCCGGGGRCFVLFFVLFLFRFVLFCFVLIFFLPHSLLDNFDETRILDASKYGQWGEGKGEKANEILKNFSKTTIINISQNNNNNNTK